MLMPKKKNQSNKQELLDNLPSRVSVMGIVFDVVVTNLKEVHGDCNFSKKTIRIHQSQTLEEARSTLFHECVHAVLAVSGQNELLSENHEEALVRLIENAFYHIVDIEKLKA